MASPDQPMASRPRQRLGVRDLVTIGMLSAIALVISTVVGMICATTIIGAFLYIAVAAFFVAIVFLLGAVRIRKPGTIFLMGTIVSLLGMMSGNVVGVAGCVAGWLVADAIAGRYASRGRIIAAYVVGSALQFVGFMLPIFLSAGDYLAARKDLFHLSDEAIHGVPRLRQLSRVRRCHCTRGRPQPRRGPGGGQDYQEALREGRPGPVAGCRRGSIARTFRGPHPAGQPVVRCAARMIDSAGVRAGVDVGRRALTSTEVRHMNVPFSHPSEVYPQKDGRKVR